jgi:CHAT domain-containing protein/tetratricopeptide (TPR) repeat protein
MPYPLRYLSLATATLLLSLTPSFLPFTLKFEPLAVQAQTIQNREAEAFRLLKQGIQQLDRGQFREALEPSQQALVIFREIGNGIGEGTILNLIGEVYNNLGQYPKALEFYQQALALCREISYRQGEGLSLNNIGYVYHDLGQYRKALEFYQQALVIRREVSHKKGEGVTLNNMGIVYFSWGQYAKALEFYQQALVIRREVSDKNGEARTLNNMGIVYDQLGQYRKALEFYQQSFAIHREIGNRAGQGTTLHNIGAIYRTLRQYPKALEFYQQALAIRREISDRAGEATTINSLGVLHDNLEQYPKALEFYQQALAIRTEVGDREGESTTINNIAEAYRSLKQYSKALEFLQQSLAIIRELGSRENEGTSLSNIGLLLDQQNQPELAIVFLKQSVNVREEIRKDLRVLPKEQQQSYTKTVAATYRALADLLLKQDRILEAQQVLDLLKVQELSDYLRNVRGNQQTQQGTELLPQEQQLLTQYNAKLTQVVQLGKELEQLQKIPENSRTPQQETRRRQLEADQRKNKAEFLGFLRTPEVVALVQQLSRATGGENLNPKVLTQLQDGLKQLKQDAVLLYPLILDDRLELVLVTPYAPPIRRPVPVKREELNRVIADFRSALSNPSSNAKEPAQKLYNWLIQPLEAALKEANAKTIIYSPDGQLRYIPLAALYDGNQWLVQKYRVNNITNLSLTNFNRQPQAMKILAGALTEAATVKIGEKSYNFSALPAAGKEVENLANTVPDTTKLLGQNFNQTETLGRMSGYSVLHLATHAAFVTGKPEDSFIVFGNNDSANFNDVQTWTLKNLDLVVLSACETGLGGKLGNGEEILGFGYLMQEAGARASIASLWTVDDGGSQVFMNALYRVLQTDKMTKTEALRQAQIALITGDEKALGEERSLLVVKPLREQVSTEVANRLNHPYYWAPFILIGNGL